MGKIENDNEVEMFDDKGTKLIRSGEIYTGGYAEGNMENGTDYISYLIPYTAVSIHIKKGIRKSHLEYKLKEWLDIISSKNFETEFDYQQCRLKLYNDIKEILEQIKKGVNP